MLNQMWNVHNTHASVCVSQHLFKTHIAKKITQDLVFFTSV